MANILVERYSQLPAHAQIVDQIKFAVVCPTLEPGEALPSIRQLARQLKVGDGVVRRAYRELRDAHVLSTAGGKHVVNPRARATTSQTQLVQASADQCDRLIAWAREHRVSAVALTRLLLRYALLRESDSPSYVFVDICSLAAERSAARISLAWDIPVSGVPVSDFIALASGASNLVSAVLVNENLREHVMAAGGRLEDRIFAVRMRLDESVRRRIQRLPGGSRVLLVCSGNPSPIAAQAMLRQCQQVVGGGYGVRFKLVESHDLRDLMRLIERRRYRLVLFSPPEWEALPARVKGMPRVSPAFSNPDPQSLEETRIAAGVLL